MKKAAAPLLALLLFAATALAQEPLRVLVLPFDSTASFEPFGLGLATGIQRSINSLDGVYAPPVAEGGLFVRRSHEAGLDALAQATEAFGADLVIAGQVIGSGEQLGVVMQFSGPLLPEAQRISLQPANDPSSALEAALLRTLPVLGKDDAESRARMRSLAAEAPELASLNAVSRASSRLQASLGELAAAAQLDPASSWTRAEYARALALAGRQEEALAQAEEAVSAAPEDAEALVVRGIIAAAAGREDLARSSFRSALELNSAHAVALIGLADLTSTEAEKAALLERALAASPREVEAVLRLADLEQDHARALQRLRRASVRLPESVALHRAFVRRAVQAGDPSGALAYLRQVAGNPLSSSPALYAQAEVLPGKVAGEALAFLREGREKYPDSPGLELTEAELLRRAGRENESRALLENLHRRYPDSVEVSNALAIALAAAGEMERARDVFSSAADDSATVRLNLGRLLLEAGQAHGAVAALEPLIEQGDPDAELLTLYGVALGRSGRISEAISALDDALELDPDYQPASRARGLLEQQRQIAGDEGVAFEGEAARAFEQGLAALESNDLETAAAHMATASELSGNGLAAFYHGYALHRAGRPREALEPYGKALDAYPDSDTVLNNLGYAQLQLGRLDLALETLRKARTADESNPSVHVNLGLAFYGLGRYEEALQSWERAISLDPALEDDLADIRGRAQERR